MFIESMVCVLWVHLTFIRRFQFNLFHVKLMHNAKQTPTVHSHFAEQNQQIDDDPFHLWMPIRCDTQKTQLCGSFNVWPEMIIMSDAVRVHFHLIRLYLKQKESTDMNFIQRTQNDGKNSQKWRRWINRRWIFQPLTTCHLEAFNTLLYEMRSTSTDRHLSLARVLNVQCTQHLPNRLFM